MRQNQRPAYHVPAARATDTGKWDGVGVYVRNEDKEKEMQPRSRGGEVRVCGSVLMSLCMQGGQL